MVRLLFPLLNLLAFLVWQVMPGNVSVKMEVPAQVNAGSEFEVRITLNKSDLNGFSRFQQNIPAGLTAASGLSSNADFTFSENRVRLIWLRVPKTDPVTVSYKVSVDEKLKGTFELSGKFSYIDNNERKSVDVEPVSVTIIPSPNVDPSLIVDIRDYEKMAAPGAVTASGVPAQLACVRQKPYPGKDGEYIVNILVYKENTRNFARIEETIPEGYTAVALDTRDAIFTFKSQKAKFLWMSLPMDPFFTVSYRLIPRNKAVLPPPSVSGSFSYLVDEQTLSVPVTEKDVQLASLTSGDVDQLIAGTLAEPVPQVNEQPAANQAVNTPAPGAEKPRAGLEPEKGVYYRIQLAAGHKPVNAEKYFRKLKLGKEIRKEEHEGWQKYSIGSFYVYKEARDYRIHIWNTTPVKDAFVTAYNGGQRITVQEALMVTEQKWYQ